jgi:hypothetical protein
MASRFCRIASLNLSLVIGLVVDGACPPCRVELRIHDGRACCPCCGDRLDGAWSTVAIAFAGKCGRDCCRESHLDKGLEMPTGLVFESCDLGTHTPLCG